MDNFSPIVTIGVASYNNERYVIETLESIRKQSYKNIELLIIEDCSTDNSKEIIRNWILEHSVACKFIIHETNKGVAEVCNQMLDNARGQFLSIIASDDVMFENKIQMQIECFRKLGDDYAMVYNDTMAIDEFSNITDESLFRSGFGDNFICPTGNIFKFVVKRFFFYTQSSLIKIESLKKLNFRFEKKYISEDWYMQLVLSQKFKIYGAPQAGAKYRVLNSSVTRKYWNKDNMHVVIYSNFLMFIDLLSHTKKNSEDWLCIFEKLKEYYSELASSKNKTRRQLYNASFSLLTKSFRKSEIKNIIRLFYGDIFRGSFKRNHI